MINHNIYYYYIMKNKSNAEKSINKHRWAHYNKNKCNNNREKREIYVIIMKKNMLLDTWYYFHMNWVNKQISNYCLADAQRNYSIFIMAVEQKSIGCQYFHDSNIEAFILFCRYWILPQRSSYVSECHRMHPRAVCRAYISVPD